MRTPKWPIKKGRESEHHFWGFPQVILSRSQSVSNKQHDDTVKRHDYNVQQHDNVKQHDFNVKRHDCNVRVILTTF